MHLRRPLQICSLTIAAFAAFNGQAPESLQIQLALKDQTAWDVLPQMFNITCRAGPEAPTCGRSLQDSNGGIAHDTLISVAGFGIPEECHESEKKYIKKVYGLDLSKPSSGCRELPDLPGARRRSQAAIAVDDGL
jgi:hypothetical protein